MINTLKTVRSKTSTDDDNDYQRANTGSSVANCPLTRKMSIGLKNKYEKAMTKE